MYPQVPLADVLVQNRDYIEAPDSRIYPKLSVKLYGRGVSLDEPVDGSLLKMKRHQLARAGQVILSEIWGKKGAIGFVPPEGEGALCTSHFFLFDPVPGRIDPRYLQAIFSANYLEDQLGAEARGTTGYAATRPRHLLAATIPLPPLSEQRRIVARVEALVAKAEEAHNLRREAAQELSAFVTSLHLALADRTERSLGDLLELAEHRVPVVPGELYPQVGVFGFGRGLFAKDALAATQTTYKHFNRLYAGAVVLSQVKGWEGAIAVCPQALEGWFASPEYRTFRCKQDQALPEYFAAILPTPWFLDRLKKLTRGVGARRERTRPEAFLQLDIPMPSLREQQRAVEILSHFPSIATLHSETEAELVALVPAILDRAFRGEL